MILEICSCSFEFKLGISNNLNLTTGTLFIVDPINIFSNWEKQKKLYNQMIKEKAKYYDSVINKLINGGNK